MLCHRSPVLLFSVFSAGGFSAFSSCFPGLCEGKPATTLPMSLSQPCLPVANVGPTRILPHLYLGSQKDVLNKVEFSVASLILSVSLKETCCCHIPTQPQTNFVIFSTGSDGSEWYHLCAKRQQHLPKARLHKREPLYAHSSERQLLREIASLVGQNERVHRYDVAKWGEKNNQQ